MSRKKTIIKQTPQQLWAAETNRFLRSHEWKFLRKLTFTYFEKVCTNCGSLDSIHLDHIIARVNDSKGSMWLDINNLQPLCEHCNSTIKGRLNTDYRSVEHKQRCTELSPLFERSLKNKGFSTSWELWANKKKELTPKQIERRAWKVKIKAAIKSKDITFDEVLVVLGIDRNVKNFTYIRNYINYCFSDGRKDKTNKKKKRRDTIKLVKRKMNMFQQLHSNRRKMTRGQLISTIEEIGRTQI